MKVRENNWISNLKVTATICVIMVHVSAELLYACNDFTSLSWWAGNLYDAPLRFCVPVFVMLTGILLLPQKTELKPFIQKRFTRILFPFLFWSIIYILNSIFRDPNSTVDINFTSIAEFFGSKLLRGASFHLWYVYMIIGLYLVIPILSKWIRNSTKKEIIYFLIIWGITLTIGEIKSFRFINPYYFTGFIGYLVLGYYLSTKSFSNTRRLKLVSLSLFFIGAATTTLGVGFLSIKQGRFNEYLYGNLTPNVLMSAVGILLFFKSCQPIINKAGVLIINFIDKYSYGIYLVHILILSFLNDIGINAWLINPIIGIPITTVVCLVFSLLTICLVNKLPIVGKYIAG